MSKFIIIFCIRIWSSFQICFFIPLIILCFFALINFFAKRYRNRIFSDQIQNVIFDWSHHRGYIDAFYEISLTNGIRGLAQLTYFFDRRVIDGITNGVGITSFFVGEGIKYIGGGRISSYLLLYLFYVLIFLLILIFFFKFI